MPPDACAARGCCWAPLPGAPSCYTGRSPPPAAPRNSSGSGGGNGTRGGTGAAAGRGANATDSGGACAVDVAPPERVDCGGSPLAAGSALASYSPSRAQRANYPHPGGAPPRPALHADCKGRRPPPRWSPPTTPPPPHPPLRLPGHRPGGVRGQGLLLGAGAGRAVVLHAGPRVPGHARGRQPRRAGEGGQWGRRGGPGCAVVGVPVSLGGRRGGQRDVSSAHA